jgi:UDP-N-acetylmuramoyl-tripeptide--D-alanyl-D-alanine ligase
LRFTLHAGGECRQMQIQLVGRRNLHCALAAIAAGLEAGVPLDVLVDRVAQVRSTRCRLQAFPLPIGATIIRDEYKATPDTALEALRLLSEAPATRRIVVIGDLNNVPSLPVEPYYERVGEAVGGVADLVVVVGTTLPKYLPGLRNSGLADSQIIEADDVHQAIRTLRREIRSGDVVLLKGRENDRLSRIALALSGADVKCARTTCEAYLQFCDDCPLLCRAA